MQRKDAAMTPGGEQWWFWYSNGGSDASSHGAEVRLKSRPVKTGDPIDRYSGNLVLLVSVIVIAGESVIYRKQK